MPRTPSIISANQALSHLLRDDQDYAMIDVRSEAEFQEGHFPHFQSIPLLSDRERHLVGIEYKQLGREKAIELGHTLVDPTKESRVKLWQKAIEKSKKKVGVFCCWRGGLRSKISAQWALDAGVEVLQVQSGYKAMRREILKAFENPPELLVLAGWTGSQKTKFLRETKFPSVDIEGAARHRGSCFGQEWDKDQYKTQPAQQSFENTLGLSLLRPHPVFLVEDESTRIGKLHLPVSLKAKMKTSPVLLLKAPIEIRARHIFDEYIGEPFKNNHEIAKIKNHFISNLEYLRQKIGGLAYQELKTMILTAFENGMNYEDHQGWIEVLLVKHYDPSYKHAFDRLNRPIQFEGQYQECLEWVESKIRH